ncbi:MAG: hypothetical protein PG979_001308 [Rickettsia asembonensis]|nr:hypothetical protein [Rickettsia asembonensis]WCR57251.1 MAG: hypothetical protein PG979_001308 [Rickettsia asembonensis]
MVSFVLDSSIALSWLMPDEVASLDILEVLRDKELSRELQEGYFFGKICV